MSDDIFKLKKGELSKKDSNRRNEFLLEKTRKRKRADIIIFAHIGYKVKWEFLLSLLKINLKIFFNYVTISYS
jgi:hypothetical protein